MNYVIPQHLLQFVANAAKADASPQRARAIDRAVAVLADEDQVFINQHGGVVLDSTSGDVTYVSDGTRCSCKCDHRVYDCWPREAARLIKRLQKLEAEAAQQVDRATVEREIAELWAS